MSFASSCFESVRLCVGIWVWVRVRAWKASGWCAEYQTRHPSAARLRTGERVLSKEAFSVVSRVHLVHGHLTCGRTSGPCRSYPVCGAEPTSQPWASGSGSEGYAYRGLGAGSGGIRRDLENQDTSGRSAKRSGEDRTVFSRVVGRSISSPIWSRFDDGGVLLCDHRFTLCRLYHSTLHSGGCGRPFLCFANRWRIPCDVGCVQNVLEGAGIARGCERCASGRRVGEMKGIERGDVRGVARGTLRLDGWTVWDEGRTAALLFQENISVGRTVTSTTFRLSSHNAWRIAWAIRACEANR